MHSTTCGFVRQACGLKISVLQPMDDVRPPNEKPGAHNLPGAPLHHELYPSIDYEQGELKGSLPGFKVLITGARCACSCAAGFSITLRWCTHVHRAACMQHACAMLTAWCHAARAAVRQWLWPLPWQVGSAHGTKQSHACKAVL